MEFVSQEKICCQSFRVRELLLLIGSIQEMEMTQIVADKLLVAVFCMHQQGIFILWLS